MLVVFEKDYLKELYDNGQAIDKKHRFQPQIVRKYTRVIDLMNEVQNVQTLTQYGSLHYEKLHGDKEGLSSIINKVRYETYRRCKRQHDCQQPRATLLDSSRRGN